MSIAVVILNYNSSADCEKCVSYVRSQKGVEYEIVVVDNNSSAGELEKLKTLCHDNQCTILVNDKNAGYNSGNNIGLRYAMTRGHHYAMVINPDMELTDAATLRRLAEAMEMDEHIVVVAPDIVTPTGIHQNPMKPDGHWTSSFGWIGDMIGRKNRDAYYFIDNWQHSHFCSKVSGCCLMIKMSFAEEIGYFDEYPFLYCEEAILARQVADRNMKMYYDADVKAVHNHIASAKGDASSRFRQLRRSRLYYIKEYSGYGFWGRLVASLSIRLYVAVMILSQKIWRR